MKVLYCLFLLSLSCAFCQQSAPKNGNETSVSKNNDCYNNQDIQIKVFKLAQGWGFDILLNKKKYIHQTNIPAINGNSTFKTKRDAIKIATLMKSKICKNIIPPAITLQELNNLITIN